VNKFLANNGLKETPDHTAYSLRHYVEDMLLSVGVDDRVRADILGHKYQRPVYGFGGGLPMRRDALAKIAL
jgi:integrase